MSLLPPARQLPVYSPLPAAAVLAAITPGDPRPGLARDLREKYDADEALLTSSGTVALTLAMLVAAARRPGAPIAIPGYACYDIVTAAVGADTPVVLYDVDPATLAPQPESIARVLAGGVAGLVVVHLFGVPVPMNAMRAAADRAGALLIEDAAQATGGLWAGRPLGAHGDLGVLSFGRGKGETGGGGGALLLRRGVALARETRDRLVPAAGGSPSFVGKLVAQWALGRPSLYSIPAAIPMLHLGETIYKEPPRALRGLSAVSARVLAVTRPLAEMEGVLRRRNADALRAVLGARGDALLVRPPATGVPGWLRFPVRLGPGEIVGDVATRLGIARAYPVPLRALAPLRPMLRTEPRTPGADLLAKQLYTLPTHRMVTPNDLERLQSWLAARPMREGET